MPSITWNHDLIHQATTRADAETGEIGADGESAGEVF
jgi:hypothetical protein